MNEIEVIENIKIEDMIYEVREKEKFILKFGRRNNI